jgi:hypothetical protein
MMPSWAQKKGKLPVCRCAPASASNPRADTWVRPYGRDVGGAGILLVCPGTYGVPAFVPMTTPVDPGVIK